MIGITASFVDAAGVVGGDDGAADTAADGPAKGGTDAADAPAEGDAAVVLGATDAGAATVNVVVPRSCSWSSIEKVVQRIW